MFSLLKISQNLLIDINTRWVNWLAAVCLKTGLMIMYKIVLAAIDCTVKACDASLVVVGTHGRKSIGRVLMGSGAEQMIRLSTCPVLVIRNAQDV